MKQKSRIDEIKYLNKDKDTLTQSLDLVEFK